MALLILDDIVIALLLGHLYKFVEHKYKIDFLCENGVKGNVLYWIVFYLLFIPAWPETVFQEKRN